MAKRRGDFLSIGELFWIVVLTIVALLLRIDHLVASNFIIDGDEAIVGLMAKHILDGQSWPTFYYGQNYMGSLEAILVAFLGLVFGLSTLTLKWVPLICAVLLVPVIYLLGRRVGGLVAAWCAALLIAVPPTALVVWSTKARGGFIEILLLGAIALLLTMRFSDRGKISNLFWTGVMLGIGWWVNQQIIYFMLPIAAWCGVLLRERELRSERQYLDAFLMCSVAGGVGFMAGSLPFWIYNLRNNFISFEIFSTAKEGSVTSHLEGFFSQALPILIGAKEFWSAHEIFTGAFIYVAVVYVIVLAFGIFGSSVLRPAELRRRAFLASPIALLVMTLLTCGIVFVMSSFGWLSQAPRYLLPAYVPLFVLFGTGIAAIWHNNRGIAGCLIMATTLFNLYTSFPNLQYAIPGEPFVSGTERVAKDHRRLIEWLDTHKIEWIRTNYWIGYRLAFETQEKVRFRTFQEPKQERIRDYVEDSQSAELEKMPLVLVPSQAVLVEQALKLLRTEYKREQLDGYVVLYDLQPQKRSDLAVSKLELTAQASDAPDAATLGVDNDLQTRWGSAKPQNPNMHFVVTLQPPRQLDNLQYSLSHFESDYPRELEIVVRAPDGTETVVMDRSQYKALRFYLDGKLDLILPLPEVIVSQVELRQLGSDPVFDWSIVELLLNSAPSIPVGRAK